ncbi:MAG: ribonuclease E inhibitor RraB [Pirellula sp.]|jgi:hypothetical protein|nr:ribonuclease E inhibitor RraB [Pirellula sp.]
MDNEPDLNFDIDALFAHLGDNLERDGDQELDWHFSLRSQDLNELERVAEELEGEFLVQLQESVDEVDDDGNISFGNPMLSVIHRGALTADDVKRIASRIQKIASSRGLIYEGVNCYEPIDEDELYGWIEPEDAGWRLRHMTDCGLEENADLPWAFLIDAPTFQAVQLMSTALEDAGFDDREEYDEPNEDGRFGLCVFFQGRNNELELHDCSTKITRTVQQYGGTLVGIQFYTREDVEDIFSTEDEI